MKQFIILITIVSLTLGAQAFAADLSSVKASGLVGEQANGYLGIVSRAPADVTALVKAVNQKRKAKYKQIAISKKIPLAQVEKIAGGKAMQKTRAGHFIKPAGQGWKRK